MQKIIENLADTAHPVIFIFLSAVGLCAFVGGGLALVGGVILSI